MGGSADHTASGGRSEQVEPTVGVAEDSTTPFVVVVETRLLEAIHGICRAAGADPTLRATPENGLVVTGQGGDCYWFQVRIPPETLDHVHTSRSGWAVDRGVLGTALSETAAGWATLHGDVDGRLHYRDESSEYDLTAGDGVPAEFSPEMFAFWTSVGVAEFTLDSATFQALVRATDEADHVRFTADTAAKTLEAGFYDTENSIEYRQFDVGPEGFVDPPTTDGGSTTLEWLLSAAAVGAAMPPMRGTVRVIYAAVSTVFEYERADGDVSVRALVSKCDDAAID